MQHFIYDKQGKYQRQTQRLFLKTTKLLQLIQISISVVCVLVSWIAIRPYRLPICFFIWLSHSFVYPSVLYLSLNLSLYLFFPPFFHPLSHLSVPVQYICPSIVCICPSLILSFVHLSIIHQLILSVPLIPQSLSVRPLICLSSIYIQIKTRV